MKKLFTLLTITFISFQLSAQCNLFYDGFESGSLLSHWLFGTGTYTRTITTTNPQAGTYALEQNGSGSHMEGTYATFPPGQPMYMSFWMRTNTTNAANGYVAIGDANTDSNFGIIFCYFNSTSELRFYNGSGQNFPINGNQWYHVEIQNIDWTNKTMDVYLDGNNILPTWAFRSNTSTEVDRVHLYSTNSANSMYDEILIGDSQTVGSVTNTICANDSIVVNGTTYNASNPTGTEVFLGSNGCDSTVTISLMIDSIDATVTNSSPTLIANQIGATYQWLNCPALTPINGATNQSYTATINGDYAVSVTYNGCTETSSCHTISNVGFIENNFRDGLLVYPNPTDGNFSIDLGKSYTAVAVTMTDLSGKVIQSKTYNECQWLNLEIKEPAGVYLLMIESKDKKAFIRLVKE